MALPKGTFSIVGYFLLLFGFISIVLRLIGMNISFLAWTDIWGVGFGFLIKIIIMMLGMIILYIDRTGLEND